MLEERWYKIVLCVILNLKCAGRGGVKNLNCSPPKKKEFNSPFENGITLI